MSAHLRQAWGKLHTAGSVQEVVERMMRVNPVDLDRQNHQTDQIKRAMALSWGEAVTRAMDAWRSDFSWSSNMRAYLEGRAVAPAYTNNWVLQFYSEVIREEMKRPLGRETWRIEMGQPPVGSTVDWSIKAVATQRSEALGFDGTLTTQQYGRSLFRVPARANGVWFPDGREAIVTGSFRVVSATEVERGIMEVILS